MTDPSATNPPVPAVVVDHRLPPSFLRLAAGVVALGIERLTDYASALEARLPMVPGNVSSDETRRATALAVGAILSLPDYARAALATTGRARRSVGRFTGPVTSLFSMVWPGSVVADRVDQVWLMIQEEIERVISLGRLEAPRAEQMAIRAIEEGVTGFMGRLAKSDALRDLVTDASAGLTQNAVAEVRDAAADIDDHAEAFVRRLFGRPKRDPQDSRSQ
jgi:hypothetical protein